MTTRRTFLKTSSLSGIALLGAPRLTGVAVRAPGVWVPRAGHRLGDPDLKALAQRAFEAATAAGASYADVRFTRTVRQNITNANTPRKSEAFAVSVRVLAKGAWGFAADTKVTAEVVAELGQRAAEFALGSAWPNVPPVELADRPPAATGNWRMPIKRDPFDVPDADYLELLQAITSRAREAGMPQRQQPAVSFNFERQERAFASTAGAFATQTVYNTLGVMRGWESFLEFENDFRAPMISPVGAGYEVFEEQQLLDRIPEWVAQGKSVSRKTAPMMAAPGRYEVVFDADAVAGLVSALGAALEADRALGYEANSGGTSFLSPFQKVLGTAQFPAAVTITADRTMAGGVATVRWDDEGIAAEAFPLVKDGVVVDYATSREFAPQLADWYKKRGVPVRSRGCLTAENALTVPLVQTPNLVLRPGAKDLGFDDLLAGIDDGFAVLGGSVNMDQQRLTGIGSGNIVYTVKKGKLGTPVRRAAYIFRVPDLWRDLVALGGAKTAGTKGFTVVKGEPVQRVAHSVQAVAARFKNVSMRSLE